MIQAPFLFVLLLWWLSGVVSVFIVCYVTNDEITVGELFSVVKFGVLGPLYILFAICMADTPIWWYNFKNITLPNWWDKFKNAKILKARK